MKKFVLAGSCWPRLAARRRPRRPELEVRRMAVRGPALRCLL